MGRDRPRDFPIFGELAKRLGEGMDRGEHVAGLIPTHGHV